MYSVGQTYPPLVVDTKVDISSGTTFQISAQPPSGKKVFWTGQLSGTTMVQYDWNQKDLDQSGTWKLQAYVILGTKVAKGKIFDFVVVDPIILPPGM